MEKAQIIKLRELYKDTGYTITGDNIELFVNKPETKAAKEFILWDDTNEIVYSIRINHHYSTQKDYPVLIQAATYDIIQYIGTSMNVAQFEQIMNNIKSEVMCDTSSVDEIVQAYKDAYSKK